MEYKNGIVLNLKIISQIKEKEKLTLKEECFSIDKNGFFQGVSRWFSNSNRIETLNNIEIIYKRAFNMTKEILKKIKSNEEETNLENSKDFEENPTQIFQRLSYDLRNSIKGLNNLKITYKNDVSIVTRIDILINNINNHIKNIEDVLKIKVD